MILRPTVQLWVLLSLSAIFDLSSQQVTAEGEIITITELEGWKNGRKCLQGCLWGGYNWANAPAAAIGCSRNSCLCRPDLTPVAFSALKACMDNGCANALEKEQAVDLFSGYCQAYYATAPAYPTLRSTTPATVKAETTAVKAETTAEVTVTQKQVTVTQTLKADSTTVINYISSKSTATTSLQTSTSSSQDPPPNTTIIDPTSTTTKLVIAKDGEEKDDRANSIALGVGLSFGLLATAIGIATLVLSWRGHKGLFRYRDHRGIEGGGVQGVHGV